MVYWLWIFWIYSFLGYLLEKLFAWWIGSPHQVRKCCRLLPLCPVYGLGMAAVLALPETVLQSGWLILLGGLTATAVEYAVHWWYWTFLGVQFWDYSTTFGNLNGRVCLPFSVAWGVLVWLAVRYVQPAAAAAAVRIPWRVTWLLLLVFAADAMESARILRATGDVDALRLTL